MRLATHRTALRTDYRLIAMCVLALAALQPSVVWAQDTMGHDRGMRAEDKGKVSKGARMVDAMQFPQITWDVPEVGRPGAGKVVARYKLRNGIVCYLMEDHTLPTFSIRAQIRAGSIYEPDDKQGIASFTGAMLKLGGTTAMTEEQIDEKLEYIAGRASTGLGRDSGTVSVNVMVKDLDLGLSIFADLLRNPAFRPEKIDFQKEQVKEAIRRRNDSPSGIASRVYEETLYADHPYGRVDRWRYVSKFTREDLLDFYNRHFHPGNIMIAAVGDFDSKSLVKKLDKSMGDWKKRKAEAATPPKVKEHYPAGVYFIQKEINQTNIRMGHLSTTWDNPDRYALQVLNFILGGGSFTSRLTTKVRSDEGLAYSVGSSYSTGPDLGTFTARCETKVDKTCYTIDLMIEEIEKIQGGLVDPAELETAKESYLNRYVFSFDSSDEVVSQLMDLEFYDRPRDLLKTYLDNIRAVTAQDVQRVARQYLHPDKMAIVVVGDAARFDKPLDTLGNVTVVELEEEIPPDPEAGKRRRMGGHGPRGGGRR